jgi:hypothetical protein
MTIVDAISVIIELSSVILVVIDDEVCNNVELCNIVFSTARHSSLKGSSLMS